MDGIRVLAISVVAGCGTFDRTDLEAIEGRVFKSEDDVKAALLETNPKGNLDDVWIEGMWELMSAINDSDNEGNYIKEMLEDEFVTYVVIDGRLNDNMSVE